MQEQITPNKVSGPGRRTSEARGFVLVLFRLAGWFVPSRSRTTKLSRPMGHGGIRRRAVTTAMPIRQPGRRQPGGNSRDSCGVVGQLTSAR